MTTAEWSGPSFLRARPPNRWSLQQRNVRSGRIGSRLMRLALISDIHGNDTALERVLSAIHNDGAEGIVCLGDVAGTGPQPHAVLERLRGTGTPVVMGNVDWYMMHADSVASPSNETAARFWDIDRWCAEHVTDADLAYIAGFASTFEADLGDGASALCYHGSPGSFEDVITS